MDLQKSLEKIKENKKLSTDELIQRWSKIFLEYQKMLMTERENEEASAYLARHFGEIDPDFGLYFIPFIDMLEKKGLKEAAEIQKNILDRFRKNIQDYRVERVAEIATNASKVTEEVSKLWKSKSE